MANPLYVIGSTTSPTDKATPVNGDNIPLLDSADSSKLKKLSWTNVKATLKTYFDTLYQASGTYVTSVAGTAPVASSGGTTPTISMHVADSTHDGYLSSTDWSTFNGKQPAGTYVTSVTGTSPVASSGGTTPAISLASGYGDTQNPYASKTANYFLSAPNGSAGVPTFRAIVAADIPTLNQNTTGSAGSVANAVTFSNTGGASVGTTYNGSVARTISYATVGAAALAGSSTQDFTTKGLQTNGDLVVNSAVLQINAGSGSYYTGMSVAYNYPYVDSYIDSHAYVSYEGRLHLRTNSNNGAMSDIMLLTNDGNAKVNTGNLVIGTSGKGITSGNFSLGLGANGSTSAVTIDTSNNMVVAGTLTTTQITSSTANFTWQYSSSCVAGTWFGSNGSGGSYWLNMPSLSASYPSCLGVYGSYSGGITTVNIGGYGVYSSGYASVVNLKTSSGTSTVNNIQLLSNGNVYNYNNSASWDVSSDQRIKENIREIGNALDKVCQLHPVHFEYINKMGETHTGFIAQEFETVLPGHVTDILCPEQYSDVKPELVGETIKSITPDLVPYLVKAIQELNVKIESLTRS